MTFESVVYVVFDRLVYSMNSVAEMCLQWMRVVFIMCMRVLCVCVYYVYACIMDDQKPEGISSSSHPITLTVYSTSVSGGTCRGTRRFYGQYQCNSMCPKLHTSLLCSTSTSCSNTFVLNINLTLRPNTF